MNQSSSILTTSKPCHVLFSCNKENTKLNECQSLSKGVNTKLNDTSKLRMLNTSNTAGQRQKKKKHSNIKLRKIEDSFRVNLNRW